MPAAKKGKWVQQCDGDSCRRVFVAQKKKKVAKAGRKIRPSCAAGACARKPAARSRSRSRSRSPCALAAAKPARRGLRKI